MKRMLLFVAVSSMAAATHAQDSKKVTAYAITGVQKGSTSWTEVWLVDVATGEELQSIYKSAQEADIRSARTGKQISGTEHAAASQAKAAPAAPVTIVTKSSDGKIITIKAKTVGFNHAIQSNKPFATNSAALAFDKKHNRLYYTPMGINQLRYIDLKSGKIYFFENEAFGALKSRYDIPNQITRMVIASDGNGYALTNDANHLIRFTTGRKPRITDLGPIADDAANGIFSIHGRDNYGGDIIADAQENLYLITASRSVYKISLETRLATFLGTIRGLPKGFTTNGAAVEEGSKVIVTSSTLTQGYYRFDLTTLQAEKVAGQSLVYNASDLANGNLAFAKKKKDKKENEIKDAAVAVPEPLQPEQPSELAKPEPGAAGELVRTGISVFPNPVTTGLVKLSFNDQPQGRYNIQFMDVSGKIISQQQVNVYNKVQLVEYRLPNMTAAGNYLIRVVNEANEVTSVNKLVVQ